FSLDIESGRVREIQTAFSAGRVPPSRATWPPSRWCPTRSGGALARACPRRAAPRGATPASPEHEVGRGPARDVAGRRPAPQGLDRTRGLGTGSPAPGETGSQTLLKRLPNR